MNNAEEVSVEEIVEVSNEATKEYKILVWQYNCTPLIFYITYSQNVDLKIVYYQYLINHDRGSLLGQVLNLYAFVYRFSPKNGLVGLHILLKS